jgi:UDP-3-O-acyl-N-acetylglucosamine deacetylase
VQFQRLDCSGSAPIPALCEYAAPRDRRTAIAHGGVAVEMIEHVMAALAGLQIDNCLVQLDAPEPPAGDGSSRHFVDALFEAGVREQNAPRPTFTIRQGIHLRSDRGDGEIRALPSAELGLTISFQLDYGVDSPIGRQHLTVAITPESFLSELAFARTFVLEAEVQALQSQGYGLRTTARDILVFGPEGVIDNHLHLPDECVRHKILDCLGDFALLGCDLQGHVYASRSGHRLNGELIRRLKHVHPHFSTVSPSSGRHAA